MGDERKVRAWKLTPVYDPAPGSICNSGTTVCMASGEYLLGTSVGEALSPKIVAELRKTDKARIIADEEFLAAKDARIAELEERLEIDHAYRFDPDSDDLVRFDIAPKDRVTFPDGITARDATIKLQDEALERKRERISSLEETVEKLERQNLHFAKSHMEDPLICGICGKLQDDVEKLICGEAACICSGCVATASGISTQELEATVAKAFLRVTALEDALKVFAAIKPSVHADGTEFKFYWVVIGTPDRVSFTNEDLARARDVLCHASPVPG